ncbi:MAG: MaoC family dehydratase N-terminal domain-containing protein, partial [Pseudomonadota bacterium]
TCRDDLPPDPVRHYAALFDRTADIACGDVLPPLMHWLYFHTPVAQSNLGSDGHERLGRFLPPIPFHRRMWAAGTIRFHEPLRFGGAAEKRSTIADIAFKSGRTGPLCFVDVDHVFLQDNRACIEERQTIVYRDRGLPLAGIENTPEDMSDGLSCDATLLFRYSALTHNAHKIHLDRDFCRDVEGYPGLVVHGPLLATLLCERAAQLGQITSFSFRAEAPIFENEWFRITSDGESGFRIERANGKSAMRGQVHFSGRESQ